MKKLDLKMCAVVFGGAASFIIFAVSLPNCAGVDVDGVSYKNKDRAAHIDKLKIPARGEKKNDNAK